MTLDIQSFLVTAPGAGGTAMAPLTGDSAVVRNARADSRILLIGAWTKAQLVGTTNIVWTSGHDQVRNVRYRNIANQPDNKLSFWHGGPAKPQDQVSITQIGSATAGDIETAHLLWWYEDMPGACGRFIDSTQLRQMGQDILTIEATITAGATGQYTGAEALNAESDLLHANTDYAILGATIGAVCGAVTIRGVDTGNLRIGIPGLSGDAQWTNNWFPMLADLQGIPCIPVFNSANKAGTFLEVVQDENATAVPISLNLVELGGCP